jgi:stage II sporulation protein P
LPEKSTNSYENVLIKNESIYEITAEMLAPNMEIHNKKDIFIYHTHTCESYTPSENYQYEMTGNFRTTNLDFTVARVGTELANYLKGKNFNVAHDSTYHDYPTYSGSYDRSLVTAQNNLAGKNTQLVIDLHRDAVGSNSDYAPTVKINGELVAQMMFVIGTDGGGLEHPNWVQNLKMAVKIQAKANEMYPNLFRPIIVRNSRYNQHVTTGSSIIEVGATGNTLEQCILSMECLSNVLEEVLK